MSKQFVLRGLIDMHVHIFSDDDKLAKRLQTAMRAGDRLADLIEALLDVSRLARGSLTLAVAPFAAVKVVCWPTIGARSVSKAKTKSTNCRRSVSPPGKLKTVARRKWKTVSTEPSCR